MWFTMNKIWRGNLLLCASAFSIAFSLVLFAVWVRIWQPKDGVHWIQCYRNMVTLNAALREYAADHHGQLPHESGNAQEDWSKAVTPYLKKAGIDTKQVFRCPDDPRQNAWLSYRFNEKLYGKNIQTIRNNDKATVLSEFVPHRHFTNLTTSASELK